MNTVTVAVSESATLQNAEHIERAAGILRGGGLVAFPTETVYGLGANALDAEAVKKIYAAKSRPADNPLIVHISDVGQLESVAYNVPPKARGLMNAFWPGPLTLIFKKKAAVPSEVSGGLDTVSVRFPSHTVARALIGAAGIPVAAPSANTAGRPSPTRAAHVELDLSGKIDLIIDGGPCEFGLESTIIDVSCDPPCLLRPGAVTREDVERVIGKIDTAALTDVDAGPRAPGMKYRHYAPIAKLCLVEGRIDEVTAEINRIIKEVGSENAGILATEQTKEQYHAGLVLSAGDRNDLKAVGASLFSLFREFDRRGVPVIYAESFPEYGVGLAIMNRLRKAAGGSIIRIGE